VVKIIWTLIKEFFAHTTTEAEAKMTYRGEYNHNQFWYDAQVDSFIKTFTCYCDWQKELRGEHWWLSL
jgi:hypothetical protein